jgi:hypothetical protein
MQAYQILVTRLSELDSAATDASLAGQKDYAPHGDEGGLLTFGFRGTDVVQFGNVNPGNYQAKAALARCGGNTHIMPAIAQWMEDRDEEFSQDEVLDRKREFDLCVLCDGALDDGDSFTSWVDSAPKNHKVFFLLIGDGDDNRSAPGHYQALAQRHAGQVYFYDMRRVTDPSQVADQIVSVVSA